MLERVEMDGEENLEWNITFSDFSVVNKYLGVDPTSVEMRVVESFWMI